MREIKFRAWHEKLGNMFYNVAYTPNGTIDWLLLQFTGLHDKNGKEIYEGDVVMLSGKKKIFIIEYDESMACFCYSNMLKSPICLERFDNCEVEIISNIHEHKHLLSETRKG